MASFKNRLCYAQTRLYASFLFVLVGGLLVACDSGPQKHSYSGPTMGTRYNVTVIAEPAVVPENLAQELKERLDQLNRIFSTYLKNSELTRLNRAATNQPQVLSSELYDVLALSRQLYQSTDKAFNPAVGPLVDIWGFGAVDTENRLPDAEQIEHALSAIDFPRLVLNRENNVYAATKELPLQIDLSAVAKGYAVDQLAELLESTGIKNYLVEVGGEIRLGGRNKNGQYWRIGVEQPSLERSGAQKVLSLTDIGMATSGDYRNYIEKDGVRYSHTIDPRSGRPVINNLASVTVLHPKAATADALATAFMVMGQDAAMNYANQQNIAAYFIVKQGNEFDESHSQAFNEYLGTE